jgi:cbb3-type cytochrome oxidase subunit 1
MVLGIVMGISKDHSQMPTHAHILVVGWVSFSIFGFFYHLFPHAAANRIAAAHFWMAEVSLIVLIGALFAIFGGNAGADPLAALGSLGLLLSMVLFALVAYPIVRERSE